MRNDSEAQIVEYIFKAYLSDSPPYHIYEEVKKMGFKHVGHGCIQKILQNPVYAGFQHVKPYKELPSGLYPIKEHDRIITFEEWNTVQKKFHRKEKPRVSLNDEIPLRGALKCFCGRELTGAASRGRHGKYYYYYKCNTSGTPMPVQYLPTNRSAEYLN